MSENIGVEVSNRHHSEEEDEDVGIKISDRHQSGEQDDEDIGVKISDRHQSGEQDDEFDNPTLGWLTAISIWLIAGSIIWSLAPQIGVSGGTRITLTVMLTIGISRVISDPLTEYF